jgi:hypothetical protein
MAREPLASPVLALCSDGAALVATSALRRVGLTSDAPKMIGGGRPG